ncbi:MAG TPA: coenzyme F420-0:L-glutamate ligase [Candidatus Caldiarchaeum subterraneum]|uniref:Coenzyme F420-0:L-glutamate ligase n=1 Tax=Caldiarchaeum subterraneum TaxID=311458 RepID=A0A833E978_CALS0|nr:coenzyme F420-0:L-glutamate ligase [Candidatus Caldarchaeum subterraneum]
MIKIIPIRGIPEVKYGDDVGEIIINACRREGIELQDNDIIVVSQVIVSKAEGNVVNLDDIIVSKHAEQLAALTGKDPRHVEVILRSSRKIVKVKGGVIITETKHGLVCANAGVDLSNVGEGKAALLPEDPDKSARQIRNRIRDLTGLDVAVIICDTHGRPFRRGTINIAIGCSGLEPLWDRRGEKDLYGRELRSKVTCVADELASAAELVIGQADEGTPAAVIRGYRYERGEKPAREIIRPEEEDMFR